MTVDHLCCRARNLNKSANHASAKRYYDVLLDISVISAFSARYSEFEFGPRPRISPLDGVARPFGAAATAKNTRPGSVRFVLTEMWTVSSLFLDSCGVDGERCGCGWRGEGTVLVQTDSVPGCPVEPPPAGPAAAIDTAMRDNMSHERA